MIAPHRSLAEFLRAMGFAVEPWQAGILDQIEQARKDNPDDWPERLGAAIGARYRSSLFAVDTADMIFESPPCALISRNAGTAKIERGDPVKHCRHGVILYGDSCVQCEREGGQ